MRSMFAIPKSARTDYWVQVKVRPLLLSFVSFIARLFYLLPISDAITYTSEFETGEVIAVVGDICLNRMGCLQIFYL